MIRRVWLLPVVAALAACGSTPPQATTPAAAAAPAPDAKAVSSKGAFEIDKLLAEMTLELQSDFRKFQQLVSERNEAQVRVQRNQVRLQSFQASMAAEQPK